MDAQLKQKWVDALRSGEYRQGEGTLRHTLSDKGAKFCCLGVLCDVAGAEWELQPKATKSVAVLHGKKISGVNGGFLTVDGCEAPGLEDRQQERLADMNDHQGASFAEIADYIEANVPADVSSDQPASPSQEADRG